MQLDAPEALEARLSVRLPVDPKLAAAVVRERLKAGGARLQRKLATAYQGIVDAWHLGVTKVPAVVVDRRYVVYGDADVTRAISVIKRYRRTHP